MEISLRANKIAVEIELICRVEGDLDRGLRSVRRRCEHDVTSYPHLRLSRLGLPILQWMPRGVIQTRLGPDKVIASAPDALLWRDGLDGLSA